MSWLLILTQSLEVLHCSFVALQRRVGLGGLIQQHLQSCERANRVRRNEGRRASERGARANVRLNWVMESSKMSYTRWCALHDIIEIGWMLIGGWEQLVWIEGGQTRAAWHQKHKLQQVDQNQPRSQRKQPRICRRITARKQITLRQLWSTRTTSRPHAGNLHRDKLCSLTELIHAAPRVQLCYKDITGTYWV